MNQTTPRRIKANAQVRRLAGVLLAADEAPTALQRWRVVSQFCAAIGMANSANGRRAVRKRMRDVETLIAREHRRVVLVASSADKGWRDMKGTGWTDGNGHRVNVAWKLHRAEDVDQDLPYLMDRLARRSARATTALDAADAVADVMRDTDAEVDTLTLELLVGMRQDVARHAKGTLKQYDGLIRRMQKAIGRQALLPGVAGA